MRIPRFLRGEMGLGFLIGWLAGGMTALTLAAALTLGCPLVR
jgi:hypothetical protein